MIKLLLEYSRKDASVHPKLFRLVATAIRRRVLSATDAEVIAAWFDDLATGKLPTAFTAPGGRPKGRTTKVRPRISGTNLVNGKSLPAKGPVPDDLDIAWLVHWAMAGDQRRRPQAFKDVAKTFRMNARTVSNIYSREKHNIPD